MKNVGKICFIGLIALFLVAIIPTNQGLGQDLKVFLSRKKPKKNQPPGTQPPWSELNPYPAPALIDLKRDQPFYLGFKNRHIAKIYKKTLKVWVEGYDSINLRATHGVGWYNNNTSSTYGKKGKKDRHYGPNDNQYVMVYPVQPDWEWLRVQNFRKAQHFQLYFRAKSMCESSVTIGGDGFGSDGMFAASGVTYNTTAITEVWVFPENAAVNTSFAPTFTGSVGSGAWTSTFVSADPSGDPQPQGGVKFTSDGPGLAPGDEYHDLEFKMLPPADTKYTLWTFDAVEGEYTQFPVDTRPVIIQWRTVQDHLIAGPMAFDLDSDACGNGPEGPVTETRIAGISTVEVLFNQAVTLSNPDAVKADNGYDEYDPNLLTLTDGDTRLVITFNPALPGPDCYNISLHDAIEELAGDNDCMIRSLLGDVDDDGEVTDQDLALIDQYFMQPVNPENAGCDLNMNGVIDDIDKVFLQTSLGESVFCQGCDSEFLPGDISGPFGMPDYQVNLFDLACLATYWLMDNEPIY